MITREQAIEMGDRWGHTTIYHATLRNADGSAVRARANGKCKVWKRDPSRFQLPMKHGLRDCFYLTQDNASDWLTADPTEGARQAEFRAKQIAQAAKLVSLSPETPLPILHDALVDADKAIAKIVANWIRQDAEKQCV